MEETQIDTLANRSIQREESLSQASDGQRTKAVVLLQLSARSPEQHMKRPCSTDTCVTPRSIRNHSLVANHGTRPWGRADGMRLAPHTNPCSAT
jgi:heterodisulfide reductase subunit A-like polyferredoxin